MNSSVHVRPYISDGDLHAYLRNDLKALAVLTIAQAIFDSVAGHECCYGWLYCLHVVSSQTHLQQSLIRSQQ